jgi:hypothetical protein
MAGDVEPGPSGLHDAAHTVLTKARAEQLADIIAAGLRRAGLLPSRRNTGGGRRQHCWLDR